MVFVPNDMQEAVALAHLSVATGSGDDDEEVSIGWPTVSDGMPRLLPVPSAWWETPAVTTRALSARPEEARTARARAKNAGGNIPGRVFRRDHRHSSHRRTLDPGGVWTSLPCDLTLTEGGYVTIQKMS